MTFTTTFTTFQRAHAWAGVAASLLSLSATACQPSRETTSQEPLPAPAPTPVTLTAAEVSAEAARAQITRGHYLVTMGGCNDCHSTKKMGPNGPEPDTSRLLSGHPRGETLPPPPEPSGPWVVAATGTLTAWAGPWGRTYAANLTPDKETGMGAWTEEQFIRALRTGKHLGGPGTREILPPMPWFNYATMTEADLKAMFAYLKSIPPIVNAVPSPMPPPSAKKPRAD